MYDIKDDILSEKYRPHTLGDIIGHVKVVKRLKKYAESKKMHNFMFTGSKPGTGKTSSALALVKDIFGSEYTANFIELNASDERGIGVVREKIKKFAMVESLGDSGFKVILLDEADSLTDDAQSALRRTMESYSSICKFILTCNYSSKIIEPIQSRCEIFRFSRLHDDDIKSRINYICKKEGFIITNEAVESIAYVAEGDLRKALNCLESASIIVNDNIIDIDAVYISSNIAKSEDIIYLIKTSLKGEFIKAITALDDIIISDGLSAIDIIKQMMYILMNDINISDKILIDIVSVIGDTEFRISEGADESIQFKWLIANIGVIGSEI